MNDLPDIDVIKNMVCKSTEKIIVAKDLYKQKHYEDSASRAYYSIFHILSAVLFTKGLTYSSHKGIISSFNREFIKSKLIPEILFKNIEKLFEYRQISDYEINKVI